MNTHFHSPGGGDALVDLDRGHPCTVILLCPDSFDSSTPLEVIADHLLVKSDSVAITSTQDHERLGFLEIALSASRKFHVSIARRATYAKHSAHDVLVVKGYAACTEAFEAAWPEAHVGGWHLEADDLANLETYATRYQLACTVQDAISTCVFLLPNYSALVEKWCIGEPLLAEISQCQRALSSTSLNRAFIDRLQNEFSEWFSERTWSAKRHQSGGYHANNR